MAEGKLPNFSPPAQQGSFRRLRTTFPALSPVAWSTFATGVNPARHNIFDFLNRDLESYLPELSSSRVSGPREILEDRAVPHSARPSVDRTAPEEPAVLENPGRTPIGCTILRVPITFPPEKFNGRLLSAMCTPDLKGTQGSFSRFTTRRGTRRVHGAGGLYPLGRVRRAPRGRNRRAGERLRGARRPSAHSFPRDSGRKRRTCNPSDPGQYLPAQTRRLQPLDSPSPSAPRSESRPPASRAFSSPRPAPSFRCMLHP